MRISWRPPSQAGVVLVAGMIAVPGVGGTHPAARARPPAGPALTISVSDGRTVANPGDQLTYVITVRNGGRARAPHLKVTQTLSPGLDFLSSTPRAKAERRQVTWPAAIAAGRTQTFRVVARVTRTPAYIDRPWSGRSSGAGPRVTQQGRERRQPHGLRAWREDQARHQLPGKRLGLHAAACLRPRLA